MHMMNILGLLEANHIRHLDYPIELRRGNISSQLMQFCLVTKDIFRIQQKKHQTGRDL